MSLDFKTRKALMHKAKVLCFYLRSLIARMSKYQQKKFQAQVITKNKNKMLLLHTKDHFRIRETRNTIKKIRTSLVQQKEETFGLIISKLLLPILQTSKIQALENII